MPCHHVMPLNPKETEPRQNSTLRENRRWQVGVRRSKTVLLLRRQTFSVSLHNKRAGTVQSVQQPGHGPTDGNTSQHGQQYLSLPCTNQLWDPTKALFHGRLRKAAEAWNKWLSYIYAEIRNTWSHTSVLMWPFMRRATAHITMLPRQHTLVVVNPLNTGH